MVWHGVPVMRKWILLFLLLLNVVAFFGFMMQSRPDSDPSLSGLDQVLELRLVSEVPVDTLIKRGTPGSAGASEINGSCFYYGNIDEVSEREEILLFLNEKNLLPVEYETEGAEWRAGVYVSTSSEQELINKINNLLKDVFKLIKIEKKVCKGLASEKVDQ